MGKRRFNEKGRQQVETVIDNTATKQVMFLCPCSDHQRGSTIALKTFR